MGDYSKITSYLEYISKEYHLDICINDFTGTLLADHNIFQALQPFLIHSSSFCMQIKSDRKLWDRCLLMKQGIFSKSRKLKKSFYGMCYCGVEEFIVPIITDRIVIGVICVGEFCHNQKISNYRMSKVARASGMDLEMLKEKFEESVYKSIPEKEVIDGLIGIVADNLANIYKLLVSKNNSSSDPSNHYLSNEVYILSHAVEYIKQNFQNDICVKEISTFCHCSESYINHIFKKNISLNIRAYINNLRVEQAQQYLITSKYSIAEISGIVGFNDPNYFSSVFTNICGISPTQYRKSR